MTKREKRRKERHKIYNSKEWKAIRDVVIREQPLCVDCLKENRITPAEEVHHIISFMKFAESDPRRIEYAYKKDNLVPLCRQCHIYRHHPELKALNKYTEYIDDETDDINENI
jgi:5-methylcytosine-specific restriction protein A